MDYINTTLISAIGTEYSLSVMLSDTIRTANIERKKNRTIITVSDSYESSNVVVNAYKDEDNSNHPFSIDNDILDSILKESSVEFEEIIDLVEEHGLLSQKNVDVLMGKIDLLNNYGYSFREIFNQISQMSNFDLEDFLRTDDTLGKFRALY